MQYKVIMFELKQQIVMTNNKGGYRLAELN